MKKIWDFLFSTRLMAVILVFFAIAMVFATFIENDFGTASAKALIYNSWWFEALMYLLALNFTGNIFRFKLYRREKWPVLLFHVAFIVILVGAFVTRYFGFEGLMPIREGGISNIIISDKTYLQTIVNDGKEEKYYEKPLLFGALSNNHFEVSKKFRDTPFEIEFVDFVPNAKSVFKADANGVEHLHIVLSGMGGRSEFYIPDGQTLQVGSVFFSYNKPVQGGMNFVKTDLGLLFQPSEAGSFMEMRSQEFTETPKDSVLPAQYLKLYNFPSVQFVVPEPPVKGEKKLEAAGKQEKSQYPNDALYLEIRSGNEKQQIVLQGSKNEIAERQKVTVNGLNFNIGYGAKGLQTPFALQLRDFQLDRYPGTMAPSSYASEVSVLDTDNKFDYRIYMNHVLDYKGYRFFQSSYDPDEKGTVLSVNHDYWGTLITYIGYFLMSLGMFLTLFWKGTRFTKLGKKLDEMSKSKTAVLLLFLSLSVGMKAQDSLQHDPHDGHNHGPIPQKFEKYIVSKEHADKFGRLLIQDHGGRIKPVNTYALEALHKFYKKDTYQGLTAEQVILSAQLDPFTWGEEYLVHVKPNALGHKICDDLSVKDGYTSAANFFKTGFYYLDQPVQQASIKKDLDKTATDKEVINLNDRFSVLVDVLNGSLLRIYPKPGDPNKKWYAGNNQTAFVAQDTMILKMHQIYLQSLVKAVETGDYAEADGWLKEIKTYQEKVGADIIPSAKKVDLEIKYNHWNLFKKLMMFYMLTGFILLALAFTQIFRPNSKLLNTLIKIFTVVTVLGMVLHLIGLGVRWYLSGHAPWSNGYEAVVFVAFVSVLAGLIFSYNRTKLILASMVVFASLLLGIAHGSTMNPEITNLVPVLKSYWLNIHVAVITASYAFLGLGALLGFTVLILFIIRTVNNKDRIDQTVDELTYISELAMTVGLFALSIGTFLGGVWANESWGRYWSWDPKEVWSLISMMVYVFVLHMRLVPGIRGKFAYNFVSLWSISTLIMTFFGVNYYLSGMHSYATGDPAPFPIWGWFALAFFITISAVAYWRYRVLENKE